jgi:hypothetical protein
VLVVSQTMVYHVVPFLYLLLVCHIDNI